MVQYLQEVDSPLPGGVVQVRGLVQDQVENSDHVTAVLGAAHTQDGEEGGGDTRVRG